MIDNQQILSDLKNHLFSHFGPSVKEVILFGSQARGDTREYSDFDILIILDQDYTGKDENRILDLCYDINLKYNILIDAHIISRSEIDSNRGRQTIFINAIKSGIYA
jgi:predicted nucleotidyltransferase